MRAATPRGPLAVSIYTSGRTLLPSITGRPTPNPISTSINAQRQVNAGVSATQPDRLPPRPATTPVAARPHSWQSRPTRLPIRPGQYAFGTPQVAVAAAATVYLRTITAESQSALAQRSVPITSLAPTEPGFLRDSMLKGERLFRQEEYDESLDSFSLAHELAMGSPETMLSMFHARCALATNSYATPSYQLARVLEMMPELPLVPLQPKAFYDNVRRYGEHVKKLEEYCQDNPADADAHLVLAYFKWFNGDVDQAVAALAQANITAEGPEDQKTIEAVDTFWDGMVASGLVEGKTIEPQAEQDPPEQAPPPADTPDPDQGDD